MGGICGFFNIEDKKTLSKMSSIIAYRGEQSFLNVENKIGLCQRIYNFKKFNNIVETNNKTFFVLFDGDLFNKSELLDILNKKKYQLGNGDDSSILVGLYLTFGKEFPKYLDGPFSLVISDGENLFLARDRLGARPLFYYFNNNIFIFGSEIKSVIQAIDEEIKIDIESLYERNVFMDHLIGDSTYFLKIKQLLPGRYCFINNDDSIKLEIKGYFDSNYTINNLDEKSIKEIITKTVERNVKYYTEKTDSVGVLLSGGFDSSVIAAIATKFMDKPLKTFTISDDEDFPDVKAARIVAEHLNTDHNEFIIDTKADERDLIQGIYCYEDVIYRDTIFNLAKNVSGKADIVFSGTGADLMSTPLLLRHNKINSIIMGWRILSKNLDYMANNHRIGIYMNNLIFNYEKVPFRALYNHFVNDYIPNQLLPSTERAFSYFRTEPSFPFADKKILQLSSIVPYELKHKGNEEKPLLREAFSYLDLPRDIINREKLCSKENLHLSKINLRKIASIISDDYFIKHKFKSLLREKFGMMNFDIMNHIFVNKKGIMPNDFLISDFYENNIVLAGD